MKIIISLLVLIFISSCSNSKKAYWCGDHPCINKEEKQAYFKKNMIVEIKNINKKDKDFVTNLEKIMKQAKINQIKQMKDEKKLAKQLRLDEKKRIKEEKKLAKQNLKDKKLKKKKKNDKNNKRQNKKEVNTTLLSNTSSTFKNLVEKVENRNKSRPYPDINDIPN